MIKNKILTILIAILGLSFATSQIVFATDETCGNDVCQIPARTEIQGSKKPENKFLNKNLFQFGENTQIIKSSINGDFFCFAEKCVVDKEINGDVFALAEKIEIAAKVNGNVRSMGAEIVFKENSLVTRNVTVAGKEIKIEKGAKIEQDFYTFGSDIDFKGILGRELLAGSTNIKIFGQINGNIDIKSNRVYLDENAEIKGNANLESDNFDISKESVVKGDIIKKQIEVEEKTTGKIIKQKIYSFIKGAISGMVLIAILNFFKSKNIDQMLKQKTTVESYIKYFFVGLLTIIILPILAIIALFTVFLAKISLSIIFLYSLILTLTEAMFLIIVYNQKNINNIINKNAIIIIVIGYYLILQIPIIGLLLAIISHCIGTGYLVKIAFNNRGKND